MGVQFIDHDAIIANGNRISFDYTSFIRQRFICLSFSLFSCCHIYTNKIAHIAPAVIPHTLLQYIFILLMELELRDQYLIFQLKCDQL